MLGRVVSLGVPYPPANIQVLIRLKLLQSESRVSQKITQNGKQVHPILFNMVIFMTNKSVIKALQPYPTHHYSPKTKKTKNSRLVFIQCFMQKLFMGSNLKEETELTTWFSHVMMGMLINTATARTHL